MERNWDEKSNFMPRIMQGANEAVSAAQKYENSFVGILTKRTLFWSYRKSKIIPTSHKGIWESEGRPMVLAFLTLALDGAGVNFTPRLLYPVEGK
jgi:hypothetical protein